MFQANALKSATVLVTGGGSGLGKAMALRFAQLGAAVAICGRSSEKLESARGELEKIGGRVYAGVLDVRDSSAVESFVDRLWDEFGGINTLVNNAAGNFYCASEELSPNGFKSVIDIVLHGSFNCSVALGKRLIAAHRSGSILNIVTTYTETGSAFVLPSACAKAGVAAMTNSLAYEWGSYGIRVNAIAPGPFPTEGAWKRLVPDATLEERMKRLNPLGRFGEPSELADLAAFLISDAAGFINGSCVTIDGGEHLRSGQFNFLSELYPREQLKQVFRSMKPQKTGS